MKLFHKTITVASVAIATTFSLAGTKAMAAGFTVNQNNNTADLLNTLLGNTDGLSNFIITTTGDSAAFGLFNDDPFGLGKGIVLSTGKVVQIPGQNTISVGGSDLSTNLNGVDSIGIDISFDADNTAEKVFFQYVFGSEEFKEFGGTSFNDSFELLLNGVNLAKLSDGKVVNINNLVPSPGGLTHSDYVNNPAGPGTLTKLDGYTKALTFQGLLNKNAKNTLSIRIKDVGDSSYDSAVFIKGNSISVKPPQAVPEPGVLLGLISLSGMAFFGKRKQQQLQK